MKSGGQKILRCYHQLPVACSIALLLISNLAQASEKICKDVFIESNRQLMASTPEIAELYLASNTHENPVVREALKTDFNSRFAEISLSLGSDRAKKTLRAELARIRAGETRITEEGRRRKEQSAELRIMNFKPKKLAQIPGRRMTYRIDESGFPNGDIEFMSHGKAETERLRMTSGPPYFKLERLVIPDIRPGFSDRPVMNWKIREVGGRLIGIGTKTAIGATSELWIWDVAKGRDAVRSLPKSSDGALQPPGYSVSPNGKYFLTINGIRLHRLDLDSGEIKTVDGTLGTVGGWVRDDGTLVIWRKDGHCVRYSPDLTNSDITRFPNYPMVLTRAVPSPDQTQALLFDGVKNAYFVDLQANSVYPKTFLTPDDAKIIWRKDYVWVEANQVIAPTPRDMKPINDPNKVVHLDKGFDTDETERFSVGLQIFAGESSFANLIVSDLDKMNQKWIRINSPERMRIWGTTGWKQLDPIISPDGRFVAIHALGASAMIFDVEFGQHLGDIKIDNASDIVAPPRWSPDGQRLMIEVLDNESEKIRTEIWSLDGGLL